MSRGRFVDLSQWNIPADKIDWPTHKQWSQAGDGISRMCVRVSYGTGNGIEAIRATSGGHNGPSRRRLHQLGILDTHFRSYRDAALSVGFDELIYYHYAYPQLNSPQAEAAHQASILGPVRPHDTIMLDIEENVPQATAEWCYQWLLAQRANYPHNEIILYSFPSFIAGHLQDSRLSAYPLFLASWQFDPNTTPPCPAPWKSYRYLQYTDRATTIPGIPGTVDADVFVGGQDVIEQPLDISEVATWFTQVNATSWQARDQSGKPALDAQGNPLVVRDGMLAYLRAGRASDAAFGNFTRLGLPLSNEHTVGTNVAEQVFERGIVRWDPQNMVDNPPGTGNCYTIHLEPFYVALSSLPTIKQQLSDTQTQLQHCSTTLKITGQQLKDAQTALQAATDHKYATAALQAQAILAPLPPYPALQSSGKAKADADEQA